MDKKNLILNKVSIIINVIFIVASLIYINSALKGPGDDFFVGGYIFAMIFLGGLYLVTFIHLFKYNSLKEKIFVGLADLFPIIALMIVSSIIEPTRLSLGFQITSILYSLLGIYVFALVIIFLVNVGVGKVWEKIQNR